MAREYENYIEFLNNTLQIPDVQKYTAIDLFAGCGGLSLGFEAAGIKTIGYEMVSDCCETYRRNLGSECHQIMITPDMDFPKVQVVIGGPHANPLVGGENSSAKKMRVMDFLPLLKQFEKLIRIFGFVKM